MKTIIGVAGFKGMMERSLDRAKKRYLGERVRPERRIMFEHPEDVVSFLTPHRNPALWRSEGTSALG